MSEPPFQMQKLELAREVEPRDDALHARRLAADQAAMLGTLVAQVQGLTCMMRDLVDAALTPDVRDIVDQLHQVRAHSQEADVMNASYRAELEAYHAEFGPLPEASNGSQG